MNPIHTPAPRPDPRVAVERRGGRFSPSSPATSAEMVLGLKALLTAMQEVGLPFATQHYIRIAERLAAAGFMVRKI